MNSVLKLSYENYSGNLIWIPPYIYPLKDLKNGINMLIDKGYWVSQFPEGDGLCFKMKAPMNSESFIDFEMAFPWMNIITYTKDEKFNFERDLYNQQIVILPVSRLRINQPIYSKEICLFPPGEIELQKLDINLQKEVDFENSGTRKDLRDLITAITEIDNEVFLNNPLVIFRSSITLDKYQSMTHQEDVQLIKAYSEQAETVLDLVRFYECNYTIPEFLPAKAGIWNDRYSTMLIYFPAYKYASVQSREVELKTFIKGIGVDLEKVDNININPIFYYKNDDLGEIGKLAKYALKLNTLVAETENDTMKFIQIMTLLEYLINPYDYQGFKKNKGKIITYIAKNKKDYNDLSEKFMFYSKNIRTEIIHNGKRMEEIILSSEERKKHFEFFHNLTFIIIQDFIRNFDLTWQEYEKKRNTMQQVFL